MNPDKKIEEGSAYYCDTKRSCIYIRCIRWIAEDAGWAGADIFILFEHKGEVMCHTVNYTAVHLNALTPLKLTERQQEAILLLKLTKF